MVDGDVWLGTTARTNHQLSIVNQSPMIRSTNHQFTDL
jgi:hypothetical protein